MIDLQPLLGPDVGSVVAAGCLLVVLVALATLGVLLALFAIGCLALAVLIAIAIAALMGAFDPPRA
jgi:hypothetical protein